MAGDKSHSYELVEMAGTPLQHEDLRGRTNNLASSLARRRYGDIEWIKSAVQFRREEINSRDIAGRPLLQVLLQMPWKGGEDSLEAGLKILINSGAEVDLQDGHGQTALHVAVEERVPRNALQVLLESSDNVNKTDHNYRTPLYYLLDCSDAVDSDMLTTLLEVGANPFCSHIDGETRVDCPLLLLLNQPATLMQNLKVFSQICPEDESRMAKTLLHHALSCSKAPTVDVLLLLQEIDFIIPKCDSGELLLMATESAQDAEMKVDLLLEHGVDLEATTSSGMGLSHMATRTGSLRILQKATAVTKSVIDKADTTGNTPLHYASSSNSSDKLVVDCVNYLLSSGASTDVENNSGLSPLDTALSFQKKVVVIALLKANPRLPKPRVARTLTIDQLSLLADFDVIAAFRSPMVATLRIVGLIQRISENTFDVQKDQYRELSQELEKTASKMLTFGVSDINSQVLFAAVESGMKKFVSENKVQDYVDRQWLGSVTKLKTSNLTASLYWVLITAFLPFIILFYALPRYGSNYGVFLDDLLMTKRSFAVSHFVHIVYHFSFILLLQYDTTITGGIVTEGSFSGTEISVLCFFLGFLLYNFEQCRMKGTKVYFSSWINVVDVLIILLFTTYFVTRTIEIVYLHIEDGPETSYDLLLLTSVLASLTYAVASFLFIFRFISFLKAFPTIGPIILSFKRIIRDSVAFLVLWQLFILAFSILLSRGYAASAYQKYPEVLECARQWLNGTNSTDIDDQTILQLLDFCGKEAFYQVVPGKVRGFRGSVTLIWALFGLAERDEFHSSEDSATIFGEAVFIFWNVVAIIILSNIMIAVITNAFQSVQDNVDAEWKFSKAEILCDHQTSPRIPPPANISYYVAILIARIISFCLSPWRCETAGYREECKEDDETDISCELLSKLKAWKEEDWMENAVSRGDLIQEVNELKDKLTSMDTALQKLLHCYFSAPLGKGEDTEIGYK